MEFLKFLSRFVGGHCIAIDSYYLSQFLKNNNQNLDLIDSARNINESMVNYYAKIIKEM